MHSAISEQGQIEDLGTSLPTTKHVYLLNIVVKNEDAGPAAEGAGGKRIGAAERERELMRAKKFLREKLLSAAEEGVLELRAAFARRIDAVM